MPGLSSSICTSSPPVTRAYQRASEMKMTMTMKQQLVVAVLVLLAVAGVASAATCDVGQLAPCAPALASGTKPTASCCSSLKAQQGCFCQYARNPTYARYINSPNAKKVVGSCGLTVPRC